MTCEEAIEKIKSGEIYCRNRDLTGDLLSLLASKAGTNDSANGAESIDVLKESNEWYVKRNHKLSEIIIGYIRFCKLLRSSIVPTEDIFTDFKIDTKKVMSMFKMIPNIADIDPEILATLKEIVEAEGIKS